DAGHCLEPALVKFSGVGRTGEFGLMRIGNQRAKNDGRQEPELVRRLSGSGICLLCGKRSCKNGHGKKRRDKSLVWLLLSTHSESRRRYGSVAQPAAAIYEETGTAWDVDDVASTEGNRLLRDLPEDENARLELLLTSVELSAMQEITPAGEP